MNDPIGYAVAASHPQHPTYLILNAGSTFFRTFDEAENWYITSGFHMNTMSGWEYRIVALNPVYPS